MDSSESVHNALRHVIDPELGVNIVDLGLVYDVTVQDEAARVQMTLTTPGCPLHNTIVASAEQAIRHFCMGIE